MTHSKPNDRISLLDQLEKCKEEKSTVEVLTDSREVTGTITTIGSDYIGIVSSVERTTQTDSKGQDGTIEKNEFITVYELEVFLKFADIRAVSKVLKTVPR